MASIEHLKVAEVGDVLEQEFIRRYGENEYQRLYRTIDLQFQENTTSQEDQIIGVITLIGKSTNQTNIFLSLLWLSKKQITDPIAQEMLSEIRQKTTAEVLLQARKAIHASMAE